MAGLVGLPAIPSAVCPSSVSALGATGIGTVCTVAQGVSGAVGSAAGSVVGFGVSSVLDAVASWVTSGAVWLLGQIGGVLSATTAIDLGAPWFRAHYATMAALAGVVIVPLLLLGILQALYRQDAGMLLRTALVHVPLAVLLTAVAVTLVQLGLAVTDSMCATVSQGAGLDTGHFLGTVTTALAPAQAVGQPGAPTFVLFLGGIAVVAGAVLVWLELLLRSAAVYVAVLFLPLALAALAWPAIAHWSRRLVDTLAALVLSKLVIVAVLSLAAGALAGGSGSTPSGASGASGSTGSGGFAAVLGGAALLLLAAFAPWSLFRLLPFLEAGAVGHLEGLGQRARHQAATPVRGLATVALRAAAAGPAAGAVGVLGTVASGADAGGGGGPTTGGAPGRAEAHGPAGPNGGGGAGPGGSASSIGMRPPSPHSDEVLARLVAIDAEFAPSAGAGTGTETGAASDTAPLVGGPGPRAGLPSMTDRVGAGVPTVPPAGAPAMPPGVTYVGPLPRQTGTLRPDHLGRDHLGPVLIAGDQRPESGAG